MKATLLFIFVLGSTVLWGQQLPFTTFMQTNWQLANPAAMDRIYCWTGKFHPTFKVSGNFRQQWSGFEGAPQTYYASFEHSPRQRFANSKQPRRIGVNVFGDKTDALSTEAVYLNYTKFFSTGSDNVLRVGISSGLIRNRIDFERLQVASPDPYLQTINDNQLFLDASFGFVYHIAQKAYFGLSIPQTLSFYLEGKDEGDGLLAWKRSPHIYFLGGMNIFPGTGEIAITAIEPTLWLRYTPNTTYSSIIKGFPISADISARLYLIRQLWCGAGFSTNKNFSVEVGYYPNQKTSLDTGGSQEDRTDLRIGLSYNQGIGSRFNLGPSFELMASYALYGGN